MVDNNRYNQQDNCYNKFNHLQLVEQQIQRMANNSFKIKNWSITIIGGAIGYWLKEAYAQKTGFELALLIVIITALFWWLDAYYLMLEKGYRDLYAAVDNNKTKNYTLNIAPYISKMDIKYVALTSKILIRIYLLEIVLEIILFGHYYFKFKG